MHWLVHETCTKIVLAPNFIAIGSLINGLGVLLIKLRIGICLQFSHLTRYYSSHSISIFIKYALKVVKLKFYSNNLVWGIL